MRHGKRAVHLVLLAGALAGPLALGGCMHHSSSSPWMSVEESSYEHWERDTHRSHKGYDVRADDEQREYWQWRTSHS